MSKKNKIPIFPVLFRTPEINHLYESIEYFGTSIKNKTNSECAKNNIFTFRLVPEYFKLNLRDTSFKSKIIPQYNWGYSILLNDSDSIEGYMQRQFNSKKRNILTRYVKRLELCFNIKYNMFYGEMPPADYDFIMQSLYDMIIARFEERNETHKNLYEWQTLAEDTYEKILNKEASLFVIYNEDEPIEISLNYHYDKVLFSYISSFKIDYSKFGLGHVEIYKQIEWCANNGYKLFEMGVGGMDYKRRWSNNIYRYNYHLTYNGASLLTSYKARISGTKLKLKEYLKSKKINEILPLINNYLTPKRKNSSNIVASEIRPIDGLDLKGFKELSLLNNDSFLLKKHVYSFLYTTITHSNDIKIYKNNSENLFIVKSAAQYQKITLNV
ncbi:GNAT family N-acetyltransferase [Flavivirga eckloniae]|uniref:BioF2-like acetyltransferase domain-containing protein n=1 Tax=Flavivirga eckloniae TaxID=1803846 RepID=A0A2K9PJL4_9FLAO|nr:GNAT family N-acetyltransferase [Flavivirga eckloniae]AUP77251.1 hypothetical protein C1H87_00370 [Flavivirga eckloniae]